MSDRALSFLIHGFSKAGKTTIANTGPTPRLVLDVEAASRFLQTRKIYWNPKNEKPPVYDGTWDTCIVQVIDYTVALSAYDWLKSGNHPFKTIILDSMSELQVKAQEFVNGRDKMQTQHWGQLLSQLSFFGRDLRDLTVQPQVDAVVITAMTTDKGGIQKPYLQGQIANQVPYWYDVTGYLFVDQETDEHTGQVSVVRSLLTTKHPQFEAGNRIPGFPPIIKNPNISEIIVQVFGPEEQRN